MKTCEFHKKAESSLGLLLVLGTVAILASSTLHGHAQSTAFTYHGVLSFNRSPVTGLYDMQFTIFGTDIGGAAVAGPLPKNAVPVTNGLFTARMDFLTGIFTGPARWIEISVRPAGGGAFQTLSPRQELTSSPYSIRSLTAADVANGAVVKSLNTLKDNVTLAAGANVTIAPNGNTLTISSTGAGSNIWSLSGANTYYNGGNVGIGTTTPNHRLRISGGAPWTTDFWSGALELDNASAIGWRANSSGNRFGLGQTHGGLHFFATGSDPGMTGNPANYLMTFNDAGNVGVGTVNPIRKLHVEGDQFLSGSAYFGERGRQMFNLFGTGFGIGIQTAALYSRSGGGFAWHLGGTHSDITYDSGGGTTLMTLDGTRGLDFGSRGGQHINLWGSLSPRSFGFGIQAETLYARVGNGAGDGFAWYKGGFHNDGHRNPGGGKALMTLEEETGLVVNGRTSTKTLTITGGADLAEPFPMEEAIEKGSVVVIDRDHPGRLKRSAQAYDKRVAGIVSGANGISPGIALKQEGALDQGENVALTGRVYVLADASNGNIQPGDLLTTSDTPGHAMKATDHARAQGAILGKAMSTLNEGKGMVLVLVTLQ